MSSKLNGAEREPMVAGLKLQLRDLRNQLSVLNRQVGSRINLKEIDHDCLDLIARDGPLSPSALAEKARLHPATVTGVLDRLERAEWITRDRVRSDRRAVLVAPRLDRIRELAALYGGMNTRIDDVCADYTDADLMLVAGFLNRIIEAGAGAAEELVG